MSIIEAIDHDLALARKRVSDLETLRESAAELDINSKSGIAESAPSDRDRPRDEPTAQRKPAARRRGAKQKPARNSSDKNGKKGGKHDATVLAFIEANPGCSKAVLAGNTGISKGGLAMPLRRLKGDGKIRTEGATNAIVYFPAGDAPRPSEAPAQSTAPARVSRSLPDQRVEERKARQDHMAGIELAVIELVKDSEPISVDDVTTILLEQHADWDWEAITSTVKNAKRRNELKTRPDGQLVLASSPITGASEGPKTNTERQVCEAVASIGLTASEISSSTQISERQVRDIAASLVRRGVLTRYGKPERPVFEMAGEAAAA